MSFSQGQEGYCLEQGIRQSQIPIAGVQAMAMSSNACASDTVHHHLVNVSCALCEANFLMDKCPGRSPAVGSPWGRAGRPLAGCHVPCG